MTDLFDRGKQPVFWAGFHNNDTSGVGKKTHLEEFIRSVNGFQLESCGCTPARIAVHVLAEGCTSIGYVKCQGASFSPKEETQWGQMIKSKGVSRLDACPSKRIKMNYWRVASTALAEAMSQRHTSKVLVAVNKDFSGRWSLYRSILWQAELLSMAESLRKNPEWNPVFTVYDVKGTCSSALGPAVKYHLENLAGRRVRVMCFDCSRGLPSATSGQACSRQQEVLESEAPRRSCVEGDCQNGWGWAEWPTGDVYKGDFRDGQPNGRGSSQAPDGSAYEGDWKDGEKHGKGTLRFAQGAVYSGSYKNNLEDGFGTYRFSNGGTYKGHFKLGTMNGNGLMVFANGAKYDGHWKDGKKDGVGTFTWPSGNIYVGAWKDDEMAGSL